MDHTHKPAEALGLPMPGPSRHRASSNEEAPPFLPLRLVNEQGGMIVLMIRPEMLVGRHRDVDVRLPLPDVSRRHCRFVYADGSWQVFDLKSLNGVFVNGQRVEHALLHHGDVIGIGGFTFAVDLTEQASSAQGSAGTPNTMEALPRSTSETAYEQRRAS